MPGIDIRIVVEDVTTQLGLGYDRINLERSNTVGGAYSNVVFEPLVAGDYYYTLNDPTGDLNKWYRYRFEDNSGTPASVYSDPFRVDGVTRLRVRQGVLEKYNAGLIFSAEASSDLNTITTLDSRVVSQAFRTNRFKGQYVLANTGNNAGLFRVINASSQIAASASLEVNPDFAADIAVGDQFEIHYLAPPDVLNSAINRGFTRYYYVDRVPLPGIANQDEYDLSEIPWLIDKDQIHDVRWYPNRTNAGVDDGIDESWGQQGKWWQPRQDADRVVLKVYPPLTTAQQLWLETTRPMHPLYTDVAAAPPICAEELAIALAYDELLSWLSRPGNGTVEERKSWIRERQLHSPELHRLLKKHRPKPRFGPAQMTQPPVVPRPFSAR